MDENIKDGITIVERSLTNLVPSMSIECVHTKAQGASDRTERKPFEPERFSALGRTRIGLERSGCTKM